jgi:hypothetical protein
MNAPKITIHFYMNAKNAKKMAVDAQRKTEIFQKIVNAMINLCSHQFRMNVF